ncbi:MAG: zf-HC2 domain-containing protein [Thermovirgaceae bacterium]
MKNECGKAFDLLSARIDGEIKPMEKAWLENHLRECPECRRYEEFLARMNKDLVVPPSRPQKRGKPSLRLRGDRRFGGFALPAICLVLGIFLGAMWGPDEAGIGMASRVASPVAWVQASEPAKRAAAGAAAPVAEMIEWYQLAIAEELSRDQVDWMKVRRTVETVNSWRRELELLAIHVIYEERVSSPSAGGNGSSWLALLGSKGNGAY